jgi:hypothetical protein
MIDYCSKPVSDTNRSKCEEQIFTSINKFNSAFKDYETAYNSYIDKKDDGNSLIINYLSITEKLEELKRYVDNYTTNYLSTTAGKQDSKEFYDKIMNKYSQMVENRRKLDQQIYDLYTNEYDSVYSNKQFVDSTVVTGILWTMIVTFMLYYVIVKM